MNPWLSSALADSHARELRGEPARSQARETRPGAVASRVGPPGTEARAARGARHGGRVRYRLGFALVEAGLHLLATDSRN